MNRRGIVLLLLPSLLLVALGLCLPTAGHAQGGAATWSNFAPAGWVATTPFTASVAVQDPAGLLARAAYRVSTDSGLTWTDWLTTHLTITQPLSTSLVITVDHLTLPDGDGLGQIQFRAWESPTHTVESPAFSLRVDTRPPTVTILSPVADRVVEQFTISGQADDATSGVARVTLALQDEGGRYWNGAAWQSAPAWLTATGTISWTYAGPLPAWTDGYYTVRARATDAAGHQALSAPVTVRVDRSAPSTPISATLSPAGWTSRNAFTVTWTNPFDPAGIAGAWYQVGRAPTHNGDGTFVAGANLTHLTDITVPVEGEVPVYVWLQDGLGHADFTTAARLVAHYDATAPWPPFGLRASPSGWQRINDFSLTWTNPTDMSGIAGVYYRFNTPPTADDDGIFVAGQNITRLEHLQVPGEGKFDVYIWLQDGAGNADYTRANSVPDAFWYDATPPRITPDVVGTLGQNGWYTSPVTVTLDATDALSGLDDVRYRVDAGPWTSGMAVGLSDDGVHTLAYRAVDLAGNWTPTQTITVSIDQSPPVLTYTVTPTPTASGWYTQTVFVYPQARDDVSGLARVTYRVDDAPWTEWQPGSAIRLDQDGRHTLVLRAEDKAGNVTELGPLEFPVDRTPPVTAYVVDGVPGEGVWYVSPVTVTLTPTDTASGVVATYFRVDGGAWQEGTTFVIDSDGKHEIEFYSVDAAGLVEQGFPTPLWIDTTPPPPPPRVWVIPGDWTNDNHFRVEWATPSDLSQVVGAYYKLDEPPTGPDDGTFVAETHAIADITVSGEGAHTLYLWLKDGAGNADYTAPAVVQDGLKYDVTPPTTTIVLTGRKGNNGWWRSPVFASFDVSDTLSGPEATYVALDDTPSERRSTLVVAREGKHVVRYYSVDRAGNREAEHTQPVRIDTEPPPMPDDLTIATTGWQRENRFQVTWTPPLDVSGIWGVRYTLGKPPTGPDDGTFAAGEHSALLTVPGEGVFDVYIWLVDRAGNGDPSHARYFPRALWYDATPPDLSVTVDGQQGENGWYVGPVTVRAAATDTVSGHVTVWAAIDGSAPITLTAPLTLDREGRHHLRIWAADAAGNVSPVWEREIPIDLTPPQARMSSLPVYLSHYRSLEGGLVAFDVSWGGRDSDNGSGIVAYDVQVKDGFQGHWLLWQARTSATTGTFVGQVGHTYFFRARAYDAAGHVQPFTSRPYGDTYTHLEPVRNGDFGTGNFLYWHAARVPQREPDKNGNPVGGAGLKLTVKDAPHYAGGPSLAAWLGDPEYGGAEDPGLVPIGGAVISQTVTVPALSQMPHPTLEFWYHMITWDVIYAPSHHRWQDTFEFRILDTNGRPLLNQPFRDGYRARHTPPVKGVDYGIKHDLGWKRYRFDLTPFAGQTIVIEFSNWNRWDNKYNTYTIVDDIRIVDPALTPRQYLPLLVGRGARRHLREHEAAPIIPLPEQESTRER